MKIKEGASLQGLDISMRHALIKADKIWNELGQELVITSGTDGEHSAGSLHYYGLAVDLRTRYFSDEEKSIAYGRLIKELEWMGYRVISEPTHIHIERQIGVKN